MLAIVIPYYKIDFFEMTLQSLTSQTDRNFKVYVGNDASPQDPADLIEKYSRLLDLKYQSFKKNIGKSSLVKQWERCIDLIENEEWMMILGDDDVLAPDCIATFYQRRKEYQDLNVIRFASMKIDESGNSISEKYEHPKREKVEEFLLDLFNGKTRSSLSEYIFKSTELKNIGFRNYPLAWFSDIMVISEISGSKPIYSLNDTTVYVRISKLSISGGSYIKEKNIAAFMFYRDLLFNNLDYNAELLFLVELRWYCTYYNDKWRIKNLSRIIKYLIMEKNFNKLSVFIKGCYKSIKL